ncbi:MAG TPA: alpha/beta hydrolase [Acidimicrobiales bacterium]|nr:alpha/beta hydrolase [Acidimicrobiales bacterium]
MTSPEELSETRRFNAYVEDLLAKSPSIHTVPPAETRQARREGRGAFPAPVILDEGKNRTVPGRNGEVPIRVFVPPAVQGIYFHIHGGGWTLGAADGGDVGLWRIATEANVAVVSVEYRLAPEHPWPAGDDDCEDVALWLVANARAEFGTDRIVIGGESAGGHLSAVTMLRLRDDHGLGGAFAGANLVYGCFDVSKSPSMRRWGDRNLVLSGPIVDWFIEGYLPGTSPEERRDPRISPLYADLAGLPPALFTVGSMDPLLDDSLFMHARYLAAGNEAELMVFEEAVHGFTAFAIGVAQRANQASVDFIAKMAAG